MPAMTFTFTAHYRKCVPPGTPGAEPLWPNNPKGSAWFIEETETITVTKPSWGVLYPEAIAFQMKRSPEHIYRTNEGWSYHWKETPLVEVAT